jgi:hypothetical protein
MTTLGLPSLKFAPLDERLNGCYRYSQYFRSIKGTANVRRLININPMAHVGISNDFVMATDFSGMFTE